MKKILLLLLFPLLSNILFAQHKEEADALVSEGVDRHDKGDYASAIKKYDEALSLDKDNLSALAEKALTLLTLEKYDESIVCCKQAIEKHEGSPNLKSVYVTYGNALDGLHKTEKAIAIYNEGLEQFPDFYQLQFNKGIALSAVRSDEAFLCFQKAVMLKPDHPGSHNAIARMLVLENKRIPALLAFCRFLVVEPTGDRAKENLESVQKIMKGDVKKTGINSITINVSPDMLQDSTADGKPKENSFNMTDLLLAMDAALDYDKKYKKNSDVEQFIRKFDNVCASLKETKKDNYGFYWSYYVPYFTEMKDKNLVETFAYIAFTSSKDADVAKWLKSHKEEVDKFYEWSNAFVWSAN
ncbi:MAG TPA: tetratricopeptide repeat protein [Chitinophagales bacterium]|nr:tetratricopeptide repeat protein [Chitinophagales bacterium]